MSAPYQALPFIKQPAGADQFACLPSGGASIRVLSGRAVQVLEACGDALRPLEGHAAALEQSGRWTGSRAEALRALSTLVRQGLLRTSTARGRTDAAARAEERPPRVSTLGVPTRNRPAALDRCLRSYAGNLTAHGRAPRLVVLDDSDDPATREANLALLTDVARAQGLQGGYSGPVERKRFARDLARRTGAPARLVEFAVLNPSRVFAPGGLRNALLLDSAGALGVMVDDDTCCSVGHYPRASGGLAVASTVDFELSFLPRSWTSRPPVDFADVDFLSLHEALLGRRVSDCFSASQDPIEASLPAPWPDGSAARQRVLTSALGYVGDSGMESPGLHLLLGGDSLQGLFDQVRRHGRIWRTAQLLRTVPQPTIAERGVCMAGCLGFDNRRGLPPFLPVFRNEDGVFGRLLDATLPAGRVGLVPWVVRHQRPEGAGAPRRLAAGARLGRSDTGEVLSYLISTWPRSLRPEWEERLASLGRWLKDLAAIGPESLLEVLALGQLRATAALGRILERRLSEQPRAPRVWREDLLRQLDQLRRTMVVRETALPYDLPGRGEPDERVGTLRTLLGDLGELFLVWPALWAEAARGTTVPLSLHVGPRSSSRAVPLSRNAR